MTYSSYRVKVPGKLMIAGEYAVLEPDQPAVVMAVDRYVSAYIEPSSHNQLSLPQLGLESVTWNADYDYVQFNSSDSRLGFIQNSLLVVNQFLLEKSKTPRSFQLTIRSDLDDPVTGQKYGLGSSAAVVVAVVSAVLRLHSDENEPPLLDHIFKLSAIAHLKTQKNGSGADIAAAVYGGWLGYSSYQASWVLNELAKGETLTDLIAKQWPHLSIRPLVAPSGLILAVGWTKEAVSTAPMIKKIQEYQNWNSEQYNQFLKKSNLAAARLINSFEENDCIEAIISLKQNREAIMMLSESAGVPIETAKLYALSSIAEKYGSGKSSGAGGGDCGIAFLYGEAQIHELYHEWKEADLCPLRMSVSKIGVLVTEYDCEPSLKEWFGNTHRSSIRINHVCL